jgi:hypothetical protein
MLADPEIGLNPQQPGARLIEYRACKDRGGGAECRDHLHLLDPLEAGRRDAAAFPRLHLDPAREPGQPLAEAKP